MKGAGAVCCAGITCIAFMAAVVVYLVGALSALPPSRPSFTLQSFTPNTTLSFHLLNTNVRSLRTPFKHGHVYCDHINASLILQAPGHDRYRDTIASPPFDQRPGQGSDVQLLFPGIDTAAWADNCTEDEVGYSGLRPCQTVKFTVEWNARVRYGDIGHSTKAGWVRAVCEDVKVYVSSDTTAIDAGSRECFVGGSWSSFDHVQEKGWILLSTLLLILFTWCCCCCFLGSINCESDNFSN